MLLFGQLPIRTRLVTLSSVALLLSDLADVFVALARLFVHALLGDVGEQLLLKRVV